MSFLFYFLLLSNHGITGNSSLVPRCVFSGRSRLALQFLFGFLPLIIFHHSLQGAHSALSFSLLFLLHLPPPTDMCMCVYGFHVCTGTCMCVGTCALWAHTSGDQKTMFTVIFQYSPPLFFEKVPHLP